MSSALAAFANAQTQPQHTAVVAEVEEDDVYASDHEDPPSSQQHPPQGTTTKQLTLIDVAKNHQQKPPSISKPTLLDVARDREHQFDQAFATSQLRVIAADVQQEEQDAAQRRTRAIDNELAVTSQQVKEEQRTIRHAQVKQALEEARQEELTYDNPEDDSFEADEDPVVTRAAERVLEETAKTKSRPMTTSKALSVDRHLLKYRQKAPSQLASKSTTKKKTMKDQLSAFQFDQLSLTQRRVFLAMLVDDKASDGATAKRCNMRAIEELAKDRATQLHQKHKLLKSKPPVYAKLDDARHCRFVPKIKAVDGANSRGRDEEDDENNGGGDAQRREDFIRRMEATERVRTEQLRRTRAERDYMAQIDKKECPQCGNPQSYAELSQKRKKCPNCGVLYKSRLAWGEIADDFLARMASHLESRLADSPNNQESFSSSSCPPPKPQWRDIRDEFLGRVQLDLQHRAMSKARILQKLEAQFTFAPQISQRAQRLQLAEFDERLRRDLEKRQSRHAQYNRLTAAIDRSETEATSKKGPPKAKGGGLSRSFEERLRKDVEQRRERLAAHQHPTPPRSGRSRGLY